ncbi:putative Transposon TX1 [Gossypium australe]|uniref:Putative Transposon TX1 n=1 Tax=Gossypium australe TaxID=47621 RepID=A0A5B6VQ38_9ROSI|nr:putative Transposon TX1 [Gossypium australe]
MDIREELKSVLNYEKLLWKQKAKCDWLNLGDRNTKYFHSLTIQRGNSNRIIALCLDNGEWSSDQDVLHFEVEEVFAGRGIDPDLNNTMLVLIPKVNNPKSFTQFRPISLCSILYKLVMKVIVNRFKLVFPNLISQEQAGFIAGRNISDNIIIAQEVIHSIKRKRSDQK